MPHGYAPVSRQLRKIEVDSFPILRPQKGRPTRLVQGKSRPVTAQEAQRIKKLVIPPAWRDVRISADPRSHIQAVGRDEAGRRQYIYHEEWEAVRSADKARRLRRLIDALPRIRRAVTRDLDGPGDRKVLATAARLVERLCLRAGHEEYAGEESGRGAATLLRKHVRVEGDEVWLDFPGKGKKRITTSLRDPKVARNVAQARARPGRRLFTLAAERGQRSMTAGDLNKYLAEIARCEISAKDFRTLRASSLAMAHLAVNPGKTVAHKRRILAALCREISTVLFNTPSVVRKSYVYAPIISVYEAGALATPRRLAKHRGCTQGENLLHAFLKRSGR
jgi:DNA topoisomerase-1